MRYLHLFSILLGSLILHSCQPDKIEVRTKVARDGSLERKIIINTRDTAEATANLFGIGPESGWEQELLPLNDTTVADSADDPDDRNKRYELIYERHFASAGESNQVLDNANDSLFHIRSSFRKRFRFFYTYFDFSDTYRPLNRFSSLSPERYLGEEEFAFIESLPGRDSSLDSAQEANLESLEKKFDHYLMAASLTENLGLMIKEMSVAGLNEEWADMMDDVVQDLILHHPGRFDEPWQAEALIEIADSLGLPLGAAFRQSFGKRVEDEGAPLRFMMEAAFAEFTHVIDMPGTIQSTNADERRLGKAIWKPRMQKYAFRDYTMSVTSRRVNVWAFVLTALTPAILLALAGILYIRYRRKTRSAGQP